MTPGTRARKPSRQRWSAAVMRRSNALDLEPGVFTLRSARAIAESLKRSADRSRRRKAEPFRSAMSMLSFHINRAGRSLSAETTGAAFDVLMRGPRHRPRVPTGVSHADGVFDADPPWHGS